ncbi:MAG: SGNH/GDSL hydrolase family protein [Planctomycetaceae bacterium]|nr:SGNH/GDSL hydrolase family protein [Planctomycetaceae bacterium]
MIRSLVRAGTLAGLWLALTAIAAADDLKTPLAAVELKDGDSIVFLGDSITHQHLYTQYVEDYFYTRFPKQRLTLHNAGVGGARAWDALQRFDADVAAYKPKYVTILLGMNDGAYTPFTQQIFDTYRNDMTTLLEKIRGIGATPILMTPTMFDARAARMRDPNRATEATLLYNSVLTYFGTFLRETAVENGDGFVDMWGPLNNITLQERKKDPKFTLILDAVHPDAPGQVVMATALVNDIGLPRQVSQIRISINDGVADSNVSGGAISDLKATENGVEFTWLADSLPWVLPEDAQLGVKLTGLGHRLSREALEVHGLPAGRYALSIDGQEVGRFNSGGLERHIELQANNKTPQYAQALEVATLNKQRNDGPVGELRGEWSKFQQYSHAKRAAEAQPDNADAQANYAKLQAVIEGMDARVDAANAAARAIEDQIFATNQPPARKYVLTRVK